MNKNLDQFESFIKASLENHEEAYNPASWDAVNKQLSNPFYKSKWFVSLAAVVLAGGIYIAVTSDKVNPKEEVVSDNPISITPQKKNASTVSNKKEITEPANEVKVKEEQDIKENLTVTTPEELNEIVSNKDASDQVAVVSEKKENQLDKATLENTTTPVVKKEVEPLQEEIIEEPVIDTDYDEYTVDFSLKTTYCEGDRITLSPSISSSFNTNEFEYAWLKNGVVVSKEKTLNNVKLSDGQNNITLVVKHKKGDESKEVTKNTSFYKKPSFDPVKDRSTVENNHIFTVSQEMKEVTWNFGDGTNSTDLSTQHTYNNRGKYKVTMVAKNYAGCVFTASDYVDVSSYYNYKADWPFIPDGNGLNDEFFPLDLKQTMINNNLTQGVKFTIIDRRSGKPVFVSTSIDNGWRGRDMEGKMVRLNEVYVWKLEFVNEVGTPEVYLGTVTAGSN